MRKIKDRHKNAWKSSETMRKKLKNKAKKEKQKKNLLL